MRKNKKPHNKRKILVDYIGFSSYEKKNYKNTNVLSTLRAFSVIFGLTFACMVYGNYNVEQDLINPLISINEVKQVEAKEVEPTPTPEPEWKTAKITAYSCIGITDKYHLEMNCPSLKYDPKGRTADGTNPVPYKTMACDRANMGRYFEIKGVGVVKCTDTGGAIKGSGRFDLYVESINEAYKWGVKHLEYRLIEE